MSRKELHSAVNAIKLNEPQPPQWLAELTTVALKAFHSHNPLAPVGCHFHSNDQNGAAQWEVTLFVSSTEIYGGALDGQCAYSRFMVDLKELVMAFDAVESCYWQAQTMADDDQLGPHVGVEGQFQGRSVWLRITAQPPDQFESGQVFDHHADEVQNSWTN